MKNEQLDVLKKFELMQKQLRKQGRLWFEWPCPQLYNKCSGVIPWKVYTIWAYSNVWKSKFAYWHIAYFLKQGKKVLIINLEVDAPHCFMNILQAVSVIELMRTVLVEKHTMPWPKNSKDICYIVWYSFIV